MDELPQEGLIEFGYHPAHIRMVRQGLDALEHFLHQPCPDVGHALLRLPGLHRFESADSTKRMTIRAMVLFQAEPRPGLVK